MATPGQAVPGTVVSPGSLTSPGGAQGTVGTIGPQGVQGPVGPVGPPAVTTTSGNFTVPNIGATTTVTVLDASWIVQGQIVYIANAGGGSLAGALQVTAKTGNQLTLLNPATVSTLPPADSTQPGLMNQLSGNTTDFQDGTNACQNLANAVSPTIWYARMRSFNAAGNPNFEIDQRRAGASVALGATNTPVIDRWQVTTQGTMRHTMQQIAANVVVPGTNFYITSKICRITLTTAEASLGSGDYFMMYQVVEGPVFREIMGDVTSASLLVRSSVANLKFGFSLTDGGENYCLTKLCSLGAANTWTLIQLPNLPLWPGGGTYSLAPGGNGSVIQICLAGGSATLAPANDTWQATSLGYAAIGQSNFAASPVNSTFDIAFVQHEPGSLCTTPIDKPFAANYAECLRYYAKSYAYGTVAGTGTTVGEAWFNANNTGYAFGYAPFPVPMAKNPVTVTVYNSSTGAINGAQSYPTGTSVTGVNTSNSDKAISYLIATFVSGQMYRIHYIADTSM
jgi:hypothetical protein